MKNIYTDTSLQIINVHTIQKSLRPLLTGLLFVIIKVLQLGILCITIRANKLLALPLIPWIK